VTKGFPRDLLELSNRLLGMSRDSLRDGIQTSLADLGQLCGAGRVYVFLLSADGSALDEAYEWCAPGVPGHDFSAFRGVPVRAFPWTMDRLLAGENVYVEDSSELPAEAAAESEACRALSIGAYINLPLLLHDELVGWLGFDTDDPRPAWTDDALDLMAVAGRMLIRAIDRSKREERLLAEQALSRRLASLGAFAAGLGHEVNNPLAYVSLNLELLERELRQSGTTERIEHLLRDARQGVDRIAETVRSLRSFSRSKPEEPTPVHLGRAIESSLALLRPQIRLRARLEWEGSDDVWIEGYETELCQVFANLVRNSLDHLPEGRAEENYIRFTFRQTEGRVELECVDSGQGFPEEALPHVFEPFYSTRTEEGGTGIGLALSYSIVAAHGGTMEADNVAGGARVRISLPTIAGGGASPEATVAESGPRRRVLVVEDDDLLRAAMARGLDVHDVTTRPSGHAAIELLGADGDWDLILCDLLMPSGSGRDVYEFVRERRPELLERMVFISGGADASRSTAFLEEIPNELLSKPVSIAKLLATIERLGRRDPEDRGPNGRHRLGSRGVQQ
jgi:signal transduction histidine kinase/ActR/RegA family two-component response regulator